MKRLTKTLVEKYVVTSAECDNCNIDLTPTYTFDGGIVDCFQGSLNVKIEGHGYGEYMDMEPSINAIFCRNCADQLFKKFPCFTKLRGLNE